MESRRKLLALLIVIFSSIGIVGFVATPAQAGGPIAYNQRGSYVPMRYAPTPEVNVKEWIRNGTRFDMKCWEDFKWYNGNYGSYRWFYGRTYSSGAWGYVHSSQVYYQWSVPRC